MKVALLLLESRKILITRRVSYRWRVASIEVYSTIHIVTGHYPTVQPLLT